MLRILKYFKNPDAPLAHDDEDESLTPVVGDLLRIGSSDSSEVAVWNGRRKPFCWLFEREQEGYVYRGSLEEAGF